MTVEFPKRIPHIPLWTWVTQPRVPGYQVFGGSLAVFCADSDLILLSSDSVCAGLFEIPGHGEHMPVACLFLQRPKETFIHPR